MFIGRRFVCFLFIHVRSGDEKIIITTMCNDCQDGYDAALFRVLISKSYTDAHDGFDVETGRRRKSIEPETGAVSR